MNNVFVGQTLLVIELTTGFTEVVDEAKILYKKPDGTKGSWTGTLAGGKITHQPSSASELDQRGIWEFQAYIKQGTKEAYGDIARIEFFNNLK